MLEIALFLAVFVVVIFPAGKYLYHIATNQKTFCDPFFDRFDGIIYRICGIDDHDMNWKQYVLALVATNAAMIFVGYLILRIQFIPFFNPNGIGSMEASLSFNTIISFMTNTNLQHYSGESGLSYLSQMVVIIYMMFTSAATGGAVVMAFVRGLADQGVGLGNFYRDLVRNITRVLLPLSIVIALVLVWQGCPQNFSANVTVQTIEGKYQDIAMGPIASLVSIKHLGTNGGGFLGANSTTPLENPTVFTSMLEMLSMMLLPGAFVVMFGLMVRDRRKKSGETRSWSMGSEARPVFAVMFAIFLIGLSVCYLSELAGNPRLEQAGLCQDMGSMEGKELRFGIAQSALFTTVTTSFTTGTVNNMHDTLTPLGGMVPLFNMMLNLVFGGEGVGLVNMLLYVILTVFICGLMVGRTPEYLAKKVEGREMKLTALCIIIHPLLILGFSALAVSVPDGLSGITNPGPHGLSQVLYEYASSAANNGSGFEGLADNSIFWNVTAGLAMFFGRYLSIVLALAIAGSLMGKQAVSESAGTLCTDSGTFTISLFMVVMIIAALTFFPALILGPVAEHMILWG
ncbi:potassium-transporting ATPase subunit KdpA [Desulfovibrio sp.]